MEYAIIIAISALVIIISATYAYKNGRTSGLIEGEEVGNKMQREIISKEQKVQNIQLQINNMSKTNDRYLAFMVFVSSVIQRLNTTLKEDEILSTIIRLINDLIPTDRIELYILSAEDPKLVRVQSPADHGKEPVTYALGSGLVGRAAQDNMIRTKGQTDKGPYLENDLNLYMAVPINFKEHLMGVICIGNIKDPIGNENILMKMIADIAAVALVNRTILGEAKHEAGTDPLTGLNNRRNFFHMAHKYIEKSIIENTPISILLFDIDNFKHYNDTNGHDAGDSLLKELSKLILDNTRKSCVVARYGGEEFIVLLPSISKDDAHIYAERLRTKITEHPFPHSEKQPLGCVSVSGGIATFPSDSDSIQKVINLADKALYQAKFEGRNRVLVHKPQYFG